MQIAIYIRWIAKINNERINPCIEKESGVRKTVHESTVLHWPNITNCYVAI